METHLPHQRETIAAIASAAGPGARGIVRVSGPDVPRLLEQIVDVESVGDDPFGRRPWMTRGKLLCRIDGHQHQLPVAISLWPTRRSYTGEPLAELHLPGSPPLLQAALNTVLEAGANFAQPGEFTLRAFLSGRIDLVQAEAVLGVIDADGTAELSQALEQLAGGISHRLRAVREEILLHLADLEAGLDFVDEDIEFVDRSALIARLSSAQELIAQLLAQSVDRMQTTGRRRVILAGLPNAGKSTLFNALTGSQVALVSGQVGTTRDYLTRPCEWEDVSLDLIDTAGWDRQVDPLSEEASRMRADQYRRADLIVWCRAADLSPQEQEIDRERFDECAREGGLVLTVQTKCDCFAGGPRDDEIAVSGITGAGLERLRREIVLALKNDGRPGELLGATAARCRHALTQASDAAGRAHELAELGGGDELIAVELREVLDALGEVVGAVYTDDILDRIFTRFCIGK
ncbi:tRNA modification GTPase MnmE [Durusdinium trenchii]|uniref:tRNA modification GTPase MnmE n=1 Tax=Durusdinium trenchii TaxID=1381693 RepID=A0ABP0SJS5_9DINO